ncbi:MAG: SH3 domain-containing protein [Stackebrandtia sp.]
MFNRKISFVAASLGAAALAVLGTAGTAAADPGTDTQTLACGDGFDDLDHRDYDYSFATDEVEVRDGPHDPCEVIEVADTGQRTDYHCYVTAGGTTWTYLRNVTTETQGWVNDVDLTDGGSDHHC